MIRLCSALFLLLLAVAFGPGQALAHDSPAETGAVASAGSHAAAILATVPGPEDPHDEMPAGPGCLSAAGCGGAGSVTSAVPHLPLPRQIAATVPLGAALPPRSVDLPMEDRPPRHV